MDKQGYKDRSWLLNEYDVAHLLGISVATCRKWRLLRNGPKYLKVGSAVRYRIEDVRIWLDGRPTGGAIKAGL
jgi:predicted DNA-binding transcriptional regulator AlpA